MPPLLLTAIAVLLLGALCLVAGSLWLAVVAFRDKIVWGLVVLLVPLGNLCYAASHWERAKPPFLCLATGLLLVAGSYSTFSGFERHGGKLPPQLATLSFMPSTPSTPPAPDGTRIADQGMFKARKDAEKQIRLVSLHQRETNLLLRKAELDPGDRAGAAKLAEEIRQYNADLQQAKTPPAATP